MEEFATLDASIGYCFKLMIEGEYGWPDWLVRFGWNNPQRLPEKQEMTLVYIGGITIQISVFCSFFPPV